VGQGGSSPGNGGAGFLASGGGNGLGGAGASGGASGSAAAGGGTASGGGTAAGGSAGTNFTGAGGQVFLGSGGGMPADSAAGGAGPVYDGPVSMGLEALYMSTGSGLAFKVEIINNGTDSPLLSALKVRYYFVDELGVEFGGQMHFDAPAWNSGSNMLPYYQPLSCTGVFTAITPTKQGADTYLEFGCTAPDAMMALGPLDNEMIAFRLQFTSGASEDATNDYSYLAPTGTSLQINPKIVVLQSGVAVWGTEPP
jgi:Cellulose binding domain